MSLQIYFYNQIQKVELSNKNLSNIYLKQQTPWPLKQRPPLGLPNDTLQKLSHNSGAVGQYVDTKQRVPGRNTTSPATII